MPQAQDSRKGLPLWDKGGTVKWVTDFLHKKIGTSETCSDAEEQNNLDTKQCFFLSIKFFLCNNVRVKQFFKFL